MRRAALAALLCSLPFSACDCDVEPLLSPPGAVAGTACLEESGVPAAGVAITLRVGEDEERVEVADHDGDFHFEGVPAGTVTLVLPGERRQRLSVRSDETLVVEDEACRGIPDDESGRVSGQVCNRHIGELVTNATVAILLANDEVLEDSTDAEGRFSFAAVPVGTWVLSVTAPGFSRAEEIVVEGDRETVVDVGGACANPEPLELGGVRGRVCAADGTGWLVDARASITPAGEPEIATLTDDEGRFLLEGVPPGPQTLTIEKGSFVRTSTVAIPPGDILELPEDECALVPDELRIAVVRGSLYDHVEDVLDDVGVDPANIDIYNADWAEQLLGDDERVRDYRILFLNCRSAEATYLANPQMQERLRAFVADGGSLHASDQAYDLIEVTWPTMIDFYGDESVRGAGDRGAIANNLPALVVHPGLIAGLGRNSATLRYALETWSVMVGAGPGVDVYLLADSPLMGGAVVADSPQIVGFSHGDGRVVYSSFHQEPGSHPDQLSILRLLMFEL
ncbi:MAG: carboxypeptidase regulatory-like domain-containing protein [Deltaproteobacteria bacterium]|nr:carboxypeptidase regulatory-like domain-containing protein [Deltaproteobacteria bacterium]